MMAFPFVHGQYAKADGVNINDNINNNNYPYEAKDGIMKTIDKDNKNKKKKIDYNHYKKCESGKEIKRNKKEIMINVQKLIDYKYGGNIRTDLLKWMKKKTTTKNDLLMMEVVLTY